MTSKYATKDSELVLTEQDVKELKQKNRAL
jgi:hypothetical protein